MRTTVTLDDDVARRLEEAMRRSGRGFKETLNATLREALARGERVLPLAPFRAVGARPLGVLPGLDYSNVGELLEAAEGPDHS